MDVADQEFKYRNRQVYSTQIMTDMNTSKLLKTEFETEMETGTVKGYLKKFDMDSSLEHKLQESSKLSREFYSLVTDFYLSEWGRMFHFGVRKKKGNS